MNSKRLFTAALAASLLGGCASTYSPNVGIIDPADFGEANRQTYAAMVVDPDPQYEGEMETSADHAAYAVERYRQDNVEQPERINSTSASGSGGGGGGGGG